MILVAYKICKFHNILQKHSQDQILAFCNAAILPNHDLISGDGYMSILAFLDDYDVV